MPNPNKFEIIDRLVLELQGRAFGLAEVAKNLSDGHAHPVRGQSDRDTDAMISAIAANLSNCMDVLFTECCTLNGQTVNEADYQDVAAAFSESLEANRAVARNWSNDEHRLGRSDLGVGRAA